MFKGLRLEDKLWSVKTLINASALSRQLGKSLFSNLIEYTCNLYTFFISLAFVHTLYISRNNQESTTLSTGLLQVAVAHPFSQKMCMSVEIS